jgi:glycosyltransferase involved in cell wall biosynthesis
MINIRSREEQEVVPIRQPRQNTGIMSGNSLHQKRILLVSPYLPFPPESGARQRTYFLWKALSELAPVDVILCNDLLDRSVTPASLPASMNFVGRFRWKSKAHSLRRLFQKSTLNLTVDRLLHVTLPKDWDYAVDRRLDAKLSNVLDQNQYFLAVGRYLRPIVKTGLVGRMRCLLDVDDLVFDIRTQQAQDETHPRWRRLVNSRHSSQIKAAFQKWIPKFNGVWVTKADDTRHEFTKNAAVLPNIPYNFPVFMPPPDGSRSATPIILTVGVFTYQPNHNGIDRFIREGWPKVRAACPTAEYWLAGKNDPAVAERWQAVPGVKALGFVDDLAALYEASWFTLCPLWTGAGTNIKVLESLAFGRTCVTTVVGHRGFEEHLQPGDSLLVAADADDLAEKCIRLINDHARRIALAKRGREVVEGDFSYEKFAGIVHREVERALREQLCQDNLDFTTDNEIVSS